MGSQTPGNIPPWTLAVAGATGLISFLNQGPSSLRLVTRSGRSQRSCLSIGHVCVFSSTDCGQTEWQNIDEP